MIPYTSEDYTIAFCKEKAQELRQSGKYTKVVIRHRPPEKRDGYYVQFARIYVERKLETTR